MSFRKILVLLLTLLIFIVPFAQLSLGFYYVNSVELCRLQPDLPLIMAIGGVFEAILFAAAIGFVYSITPARFKTNKQLTAAQLSAQGSSGGMQMLLGGITFIFGVCAFIFIVLLNVRVYGNLKSVQWTYPTLQTYCLQAIATGAAVAVYATYAAFGLLLALSAILLLGIGM